MTLAAVSQHGAQFSSQPGVRTIRSLFLMTYPRGDVPCRDSQSEKRTRQQPPGSPGGAQWPGPYARTGSLSVILIQKMHVKPTGGFGLSHNC